jgi:hypothetical protein
LTAVGEEGHYSGDLFGGGSLAGGDGDEEFHEVVVDLSAATLNDIDILPTDTILNLDSGFSNCKF